MAKKKNNFEVKNWFYLSGPLALVAFFLMDIIGGYNYPGYNWVSQVVGDLLALNSYSFVISIIFCAIYVVLSVVALVCSYKFLKALNIDKRINRGLFLFVISALIIALSTIVFLQPESGTFDRVKENAQIETKTAEVIVNLPTVDSNNPEAASTDTDTNGIDKTTVVIDIEKTCENAVKLADVFTESPIVACNLLCSLVGFILAIISFVFIAIGGIKKDGYLVFALFAIFCVILVAFSVFSVSAMDANMIGINSRFAHYAIVLFTAFLGAYVYITNVEE